MLSNLDTYLEALRTSPLEFLLTLVYAVAVILISLILHECAHGYVAYYISQQDTCWAADGAALPEPKGAP